MSADRAAAPQSVLDPADAEAARRFIVANTRPLSPPLVPEIRLHLAEESLPIWQKTEEELGEINVAPPYWAFAWAGGQALARYILDTPQRVAGASVVDLGTGSGLTAIAACRAGAASVLAADIDRLALAAVGLNAALNGVAVAVTSEDLLAHPPQAADVVLVGDLFYERALADRVLAYIETAAAAGAAILIGDPKRSYFPAGRFRLAAAYEVRVTRELEDAEIKRTSVWGAVRGLESCAARVPASGAVTATSRAPHAGAGAWRAVRVQSLRSRASGHAAVRTPRP